MKKRLSTVLSVILILAGLYFVPTEQEEVRAADVQNYVTVAKSELDTSNPTKEGYLFAGWYTGETCTEDTAVEDKANLPDTCYAKFVSEDLLDVKVQIATVEGAPVMRFVSSVESLDYSSVGFRVSDGEKTVTSEVRRVYERIVSTEDSVKYTFSPMVIDTDSTYFVTAKMKATEGVDYTVEAFWKTFDGTYVYGESRKVAVSDGTATNTVNMSFENKATTAPTVGSDIAVTYGTNGTEASTTAKVIGVSGTVVQVRVSVGVDTLSSATKFVFTGYGDTIYRNLYTKYNGTAGDTTWYDTYIADDSTETEFVVVTDADLYALAPLCFGSAGYFKNKTVYLASDINANAAGSFDVTTGTKTATVYDWIPIGKYNYSFSGTFDGNMHTISGVYASRADGTGTGLFGKTVGTIRNLKLKDSYIKSTGQHVGSIAGYGNGTMTNVYSNATVVSGNAFVGGICGRTDVGITMNNCWYDGTVTSTASGNGRGFVGGFIGYAGAGTNTINNCLNTGHIDISAMTTTSNSGTGGFIGVHEASGGTTITNSVMLGTLKVGSGASAYYAIAGDTTQNKLSGSNIYTMNTPDDTTKFSAWGGGYSKTTGTISYTGTIKEATCRGTIAQTTMPKLDWTNTWIPGSSSSELPGLQVFANEKIDTSWYNAGDSAFVLKDNDDLYGFARLVSAGNTFEGKTVKLGADIILNSGDAADWATKAPANVWVPIGASTEAGNNNRFKGIFDGDMHTISGVYVDSTTRYCGLFGAVEGATIKNLKLTNSYIASTDQWVGSIVGRGSGTFSNIYSDAIVKSGVAFVGGFVGQADFGSSMLEKCWFDGTVISTGSASKGFVGGIVGYATQSITLQNCYNTGDVDITKMTYSVNAGTGGFVGVSSVGVKFIDCVTLGGVYASANQLSHCYAIVGDWSGTFEMENVYAMNDRNSTAYSQWGGGYSGTPTSGSYTAITLGGVQGSNAQTKMPNLDWADTWQTVTGGAPILKGLK